MKAQLRALVIQIGIRNSHDLIKKLEPENVNLKFASSFLDVVDIIYLDDVHVICISDFRGQKATIGYIKMFKTTKPEFKIIIISNNKMIKDGYKSYFIQRGADSVFSCFDFDGIEARLRYHFSIMQENEIIQSEWSICTKKAIRFIKYNYHIKSGLMDKTVENIGYSASSISHCVKADTGETVSDWIQKLRVKAAIELLITTDFPIKQIGGHVGYNSEQGFIKVFKKLMNQTPFQYKKDCVRQ